MLRTLADKSAPFRMAPIRTAAARLYSAKFRPLTTCEKTLAVALAGDMAFEFDTAEAVFEATVYTIVVGRLFDTADSVGRIAPSNTCSPIIELFVSP